MASSPDTPSGEPSKAGSQPTLEKFTGAVQANVKTITIIVLTTIACLSLFAGIAFKLFITAEWLDKELGITDQVRKTLVKEVDSGYSTVVIFHNNNTAGDLSVEFYCEPDQKVELFVTSEATGFPGGIVPDVTIQLNVVPIEFASNEISAGLPHTNSPKDVTDLLRAQPIREKLKIIRISSRNANEYPRGFLVINVLVLVSNNVDKH